MSTQAAERDITEELIVSGYLRELLVDENDYNEIITIIVSFQKQGFAKCFDSNIDKDYKQNMRFGDIVRTDNKLQVLDINQELQSAGYIDEYDEKGSAKPLYNLCFNIPSTVCKHLDNAPLFYSKLDDFKLNLYENSVALHLKYNDRWIIENFGGSLNPEYKSITAKFWHGNCHNINVSFVDGHSKIFVIRSGVTAESIDKEYQQELQNRKSKENL